MVITIEFNLVFKAYFEEESLDLDIFIRNYDFF